eukprot:8337568-Pyramimonas_sp.AAC.1
MHRPDRHDRFADSKSAAVRWSASNDCRYSNNVARMDSQASEDVANIALVGGMPDTQAVDDDTAGRRLQR